MEDVANGGCGKWRMWQMEDVANGGCGKWRMWQMEDVACSMEDKMDRAAD
jgi:hypothetical protein